MPDVAKKETFKSLFNEVLKVRKKGYRNRLRSFKTVEDIMNNPNEVNVSFRSRWYKDDNVVEYIKCRFE